MNPPVHNANLASFPTDVILSILEYLTLDSISKLSRTCRILCALVKSHGYATYLRLHPQPSQSLSCVTSPTEGTNHSEPWSPLEILVHGSTSSKNFSSQTLTARPLQSPFPHRYITRLAISERAMVIAAGSGVDLYAFKAVKRNGVVRQGVKSVIKRETAGEGAEQNANFDITAIAFLGEQHGTNNAVALCASIADGSIVMFNLPLSEPDDRNYDEDANGPISDPISTTQAEPYAPRVQVLHHPRPILADNVTGSAGGIDPISSISCNSSSSNTLLLSLSTSGVARLHTLSTESSSESSCSLASELQLPNARGWTAYLPTSSSPSTASSSYAAFGTSSRTPLVLHSIHQTGLDDIPLAVLGSGSTSSSSRLDVGTPLASSRLTFAQAYAYAQIPSQSQTGPPKNSAVYALCAPPPQFPGSGNPEKVIVSGWYDGFVRVFDLRSSRRRHSSSLPNGGTAGPLTPVLTLSDPWSLDPIYALSSGGGSGSYIAAGYARHSIVSFWDVRFAKGWSSSSKPRNPTRANAIKSGIVNGSRASSGWSVHAPGNDSSPVYDLVLESSRLFGATQSRAFVLDFADPESITPGTYPSFDRVRSDGLKRIPEAHPNAKREEGVGYYVTIYSHDTGMLGKGW